MASSELDGFAESLIVHVRDRAVAEVDRLSAGLVKGAEGARWREILVTASQQKAVTDLTPDIVDQVLFELLDAIDSGRLRLSWESSPGQVVPLTILGSEEMAGSFIGSGGWRARYSRERFFDPFSDLRLKDDS